MVDFSYETQGVLYKVPTLSGDMGLVALDYSDYEGLLAKGVMDEEIDLTLRKVDFGSEYSQMVPSFRLRASLYAIKVDSVVPKPQIELDRASWNQLAERGFSDAEKVGVSIAPLPFRTQHPAPETELQLDLGSMGEMVDL